ncbi:MAG: alpha-galactosidase [Acidobacteriota bacterium]
MRMPARALLRSLPVRALVFVFAGAIPAAAGEWVETATIVADKVMVFNGIPRRYGWGEDFVYRAASSTADTRSIGSPWLGGIPVVDIWAEGQGGVALFNTTPYHEPFKVQVLVGNGRVTIRAAQGANIEKYEHDGDYFEALREYARRMSVKGIAMRSAPGWAFDPIWETYGFEETWTAATVRNMLPLLKQLGIKTITLDSGWYGEGTRDWDAHTGDFPVNPDTIGTEQDLKDLIAELHAQGFRVRLWWVGGVSETNTRLHRDHADWFYSKVTPSWGDPGDTGDWYLDPTYGAVREWNKRIVQRFIGYGADGFKIDDVYEIDEDDDVKSYHSAYSQLFREAYETATASKADFCINICNCGIAQNFFDLPGENQLITSDPVGPKQFRHRAKYLHALNLNHGAVLGDHVELTEGDVGPEELKRPGFYASIADSDFASTVALGMVLETKCRIDPGSRYRRWFQAYREHKFYEMEWINVPYYSWKRIETYLLRSSNGDLFFSFFAANKGSYSGNVTLSNLQSGARYSVYDIVGERTLGSFTAQGSSKDFKVKVKDCLVVRVSKE